jgi:hypothetical protein
VTVRRARLRGALFLRSNMWTPAMALTEAQYEERLERAKAGTDPFPHMPNYDGDACEWCGRPDWEAVGDCLARVRTATHPLGALACRLEDLERRLIPVKTEAEMTLVWEARAALELLGKVGVSASAHREWLAEQRVRRERERADRGARR